MSSSANGWEGEAGRRKVRTTIVDRAATAADDLVERNGVCWDDSVAESWFGTMKRELSHRRRWATRAEARRDLIRWIEGWYNE